MAEKKEPTLEAAGNKNMLNILVNAYIDLLDEAGDSRNLEDKYQSHIDRINKETQSPDQRSLKVLKRAYDHIKAKQKEKQ